MQFSQTDIALFQSIAETEIKIYRPVVLQVCKTVTLEGAYCVGLYQDEYDYHLIKISRAEIWNPRELFATIVHEYVHAWQSENNRRLTHTLKSGFENWRGYFQLNYGVDIAGFNP